MTKRQSGLLSGSAIGLVGIVVAQLATMITVFVVSDRLGRALTGTYALALSTFGLIALLALAGMNAAIVRFTSVFEETPERIAPLQRSTQRFVVVAGIAMGALVFASAGPIGTFYDNSELPDMLRILAVCLPFHAHMRYRTGSAQAYRDVRTMVGAERFAFPLVQVVLVTVLLWWTKDVRLVAVAFAGAVFVGWATAVGGSRRYRQRATHGLSWSDGGSQVIRFAGPLVVMNFVVRGTVEIESLLVGVFLTNDDVGLYYVALRVATVASIALVATSGIYAPYAARTFESQGTSAMKPVFTGVREWLFLAGAIIVGLLASSADFIMVLAGSDFADAADLLLILLIGQCASLFAGPAGLTITMMGRSKINLANSTLLLILQVVVAVLLIPNFGLKGAAAGSTAALILLNLVRMIELRYLIGSPIVTTQLVRSLAGLAAAITVSRVALSTVDLGPFASSVGRSGVFILVFFLAIWFWALEDERKLDATEQLRAIWNRSGAGHG